MIAANNVTLRIGKKHCLKMSTSSLQKETVMV